jgi:hypothetical protein
LTALAGDLFVGPVLLAKLPAFPKLLKKRTREVAGE